MLVGLSRSRAGPDSTRGSQLWLQRVDALILRPRLQGMQRIAIECKIRRGRSEGALEKGLPQPGGYMDRCGADAGQSVVLDRSAKSWKEKAFRRSEGFGGTPVEVRSI